MLETWAIVGFVFLGIVVLNFVVSAIVFLCKPHQKIGDGIIGWFVISGVVMVIAAIIAAFVYFPYNMKYYMWETKEGTVVSTEYDAKADTSTRYNNGGLRIVLLDGTAFFTTDFRLAPAKVGDKVQLVCKPSFQSGNVDRIDCKAQIGRS